MRAPEETKSFSIADGRIIAIPEQNLITCDGQPVYGTSNSHKLTPIITALAANPDQVISYEALSWEVGRTDPKYQRVVMSHITLFRRYLPFELANAANGAIRQYADGYYAVSSLDSKVDWSSAGHQLHTLGSGRVIVNHTAQLISIDQHLWTPLSNAEHRAITTLAEHPDELVDHDSLFQQSLTGNKVFNPVSLAILIKKLRRKLGPELGDIKSGIIRSIRGQGYMGVSQLE